MATIAQLADDVQSRLEEARGSVGLFWDRVMEIYPALVEAMNEACLITGQTEVRSSQPMTLAQNVNLQAMPVGAVAIVRVEGPTGALFKESVWDLDQSNPTWENDTGTVPLKWFPFGLTQWGIYPQLTVPVEVVTTYLAFPTTAARPYTGAEVSPFQAEYEEMLELLSSHTLRFKESGKDFYDSSFEYQKFLMFMEELSRFGLRKGMLRFSRTLGSAVAVTPKATT